MRLLTWFYTEREAGKLLTVKKSFMLLAKTLVPHTSFVKASRKWASVRGGRFRGEEEDRESKLRVRRLRSLMAGEGGTKEAISFSSGGSHSKVTMREGPVEKSVVEWQ